MKDEPFNDHLDRLFAVLGLVFVLGLIVTLVVSWSRPLSLPATPSAANVAPRPSLVVAHVEQTPETKSPGSIKGRLVFVGDLPDLPPLIKKGAAIVHPSCCAADSDIPDESCLIHPGNRGIANVFAYLCRRPPNADIADAPSATIPIRLKGCRIFPHASIGRTTDVFRATGEDSVAHALQASPQRNNSHGRLVPQGNTDEFRFPKHEREPFRILCSIHPWMTGHWLVLDHPFAAITGEDGEFRLANIPPGQHQLHLWHECGRLVQSVAFSVTSGTHSDLGEIRWSISETPDSRVFVGQSSR